MKKSMTSILLSAFVLFGASAQAEVTCLWNEELREQASALMKKNLTDQVLSGLAQKGVGLDSEGLSPSVDAVSYSYIDEEQVTINKLLSIQFPGSDGSVRRVKAKPVEREQYVNFAVSVYFRTQKGTELSMTGDIIYRADLTYKGLDAEGNVSGGHCSIRLQKSDVDVKNYNTNGTVLKVKPPQRLTLY